MSDWINIGSLLVMASEGLAQMHIMDKMLNGIFIQTSSAQPMNIKNPKCTVNSNVSNMEVLTATSVSYVLLVP